MGVENEIQHISSICSVLSLKRSEGKNISHAQAMSASYLNGSREPLRGFKQGKDITIFAF